jgi:Lrp/AsnC family leucine-responsive transcriptional regulator
MQKSPDRFDKRLLDIVQRDASLTSDAMARQVGLSPSAVQRRLKRLQESGVISSTVAVLDPARVGRPTYFIVGLEVERERPELMGRLRAWLLAERAVQQAFYVTGAADFILIVVAQSVEAYDELMGRLIADNPNVTRFTTNVALGVSKQSLLVPLAED